MDQSDMAQRMLDIVPELRPSYDALIEWYEGEDPGLHIIMGDVFNPYLRGLLSSDPEDETLRKILGFLEEMATSEDPHVQEVLVVTILEGLDGSPAGVQRAKDCMGPATRRMSDELEEWWRRFGRSRENPMV